MKKRDSPRGFPWRRLVVCALAVLMPLGLTWWMKPRTPDKALVEQAVRKLAGLDAAPSLAIRSFSVSWPFSGYGNGTAVLGLEVAEPVCVVLPYQDPAAAPDWHEAKKELGVQLARLLDIGVLLPPRQAAELRRRAPKDPFAGVRFAVPHIARGTRLSARYTLRLEPRAGGEMELSVFAAEAAPFSSLAQAVALDARYRHDVLRGGPAVNVQSEKFAMTTAAFAASVLAFQHSIDDAVLRVRQKGPQGRGARKVR